MIQHINLNIFNKSDFRAQYDRIICKFELRVIGINLGYL